MKKQNILLIALIAMTLSSAAHIEATEIAQGGGETLPPDLQTAEQPEEQQPIEQPEEQQPIEQTEEQPPAEQPEEQPPAEQTEEQPPAEQTEEQQPIEEQPTAEQKPTEEQKPPELEQEQQPIEGQKPPELEQEQPKEVKIKPELAYTATPPARAQRAPTQPARTQPEFNESTAQSENNVTTTAETDTTNTQDFPDINPEVLRYNILGAEHRGMSRGYSAPNNKRSGRAQSTQIRLPQNETIQTTMNTANTSNLAGSSSAIGSPLSKSERTSRWSGRYSGPSNQGTTTTTSVRNRTRQPTTDTTNTRNILGSNSAIKSPLSKSESTSRWYRGNSAPSNNKNDLNLQSTQITSTQNETIQQTMNTTNNRNILGGSSATWSPPLRSESTSRWARGYSAPSNNKNALNLQSTQITSPQNETIEPTTDTTNTSNLLGINPGPWDTPSQSQTQQNPRPSRPRTW